MNALLPLDEGMGRVQKGNIKKLREDMKARYFDAPDLKEVPKNAYRFLNAVSDFSTHGKPLWGSTNRRESLFAKVMDGNAVLDKAYGLVRSVA